MPSAYVRRPLTPQTRVDSRSENLYILLGTVFSKTLTATFGRDSRNRRSEALDPEFEGAVASLETFYHSFNTRNSGLLAGVWTDDLLVQLNNPVGGILRGRAAIAELYERIFHGPATVWVEFHDITAYGGGDWAVFAGRETGEFRHDGDVVVTLAIRTTRIFAFRGTDTGWQQLHHHGSIDEPDTLRRYQEAVLGAPAGRRAERTP